MAGNPTLPTENIDEVILRLLALEPNEIDEIDYQTYYQYLKELLVQITAAKRKIDGSELDKVKNEFKRVRGKKGRFRIKKAKITATGLGLGSIRKQVKGTQKRLMIAPVGGVPKQTSELGLKKKDSDSGVLVSISNTLDSILSTLTNINSQNRARIERERRSVESGKRGLREKELESKPFEGIKKAISTITKPFQSIWDTIVNFITNIILGRIVLKLIDWIADPKNQDKVQSIVRFLTDWWPALLGGYILFGTGFGKGVTLLTKVALGGIGRITKLLPLLLRIAKNPLAIGTALFTFGAWGPKAFPNLVNDNKKVPTVKASGGGYANFGKWFSGLVKGPKGRDKVPAMLTDGEFVMSAGAVQKYGVDTLEGMNASGGGDNNPKVVSGTAYAYGGGLIGTEGRKNTPFSKDPIDAIKRFINHKFGINVDRPNTWGPSSKQSGVSGSSSSISTGSLLTDPLGAAARVSRQLKIPSSNLPSGGPKIPGLPGGGIKLPKLPGGIKVPGLPSTKKDGFLENLKSSTYRDAGAIYARQMAGGFGGPVSERDLSKESKQELQKAIERAKKRTGTEISKAEAKIKELRAQGVKEGNPALETQKSFLKKLKEGGIRVQYTDYADQKGQMSESAKNAKNILGQFWAKERSKKEGGGYRVEDKYDFDMFKKKAKDPKTGKMTERDFTGSELITEGVFGKGKTIQQRLQAAYLLNPFKGKGDVDMVLGGNRTAAESLGLTGSKTMLGGMLGMSGKPKDKNTQALESKRPWWDKAGWFGGGSAEIKRQKSIPKVTPKSNPKVTPVKPLPRRTKASVIGTGGGGKRGSGANPSRPATKPPSLSPNHPKGNKSSASAYGIMR